MTALIATTPGHGGDRVWPAGFGSCEGVMTVAGQSVQHWAAKAGGTPLFLYDRALIAARVAQWRAAMPPELGLHYAIKANPMPELVRFLAGLVDGFDVASGQELALALASGMDPTRIGFAGPGKDDGELAATIAAGAGLTIESAGELARAATIASAQGRRVRVAVRVNPDFQLKGSGLRMGGGAAAFGIDSEAVPALFADWPDSADFIGFHLYAGSQTLSVETLAQAQAETLTLLGALAQSAPQPPRHINIGGGLGVPYFPGDTPLDLAALGTSLGGALHSRPQTLIQARPVMELGRYLVAEAGVYLTRVIERKVSRGQVFLVTDGGLHHQLAASGNFGQVVRRNYPLVAASRFDAPPEERVNVVGRLCTPLDRLGEQVPLPHLEAGDLIALFMAGAYGRSASPSRFLSHPEPGEMFV